MRLTVLATLIILGSCNAKKESGAITNTDSLNSTHATTKPEPKPAPKDTLPALKVYANKRFKDVVVERIGKDSFLVHGQGQIFEANFNWVLEDGHEELKKGFQMTDAGAPEWGKFKFIVHAPKKRTNSTITLVLFETSAMDGSRQHELPIVLY
jgi:Immunoglobulin-like domain of bacterial spore germination